MLGCGAARRPASVAAPPVDEVCQRLAAFVGNDLAGDELADRCGRRNCGVVRADVDGGMGPEARFLWQGFALEHVERSAMKRAGIERGEDVGFDLQAAASGVDEDGPAEPAALPKLGEE